MTYEDVERKIKVGDKIKVLPYDSHVMLYDSMGYSISWARLSGMTGEVVCTKSSPVVLNKIGIKFDLTPEQKDNLSHILWELDGMLNGRVGHYMSEFMVEKLDEHKLTLI